MAQDTSQQLLIQLGGILREHVGYDADPDELLEGMGLDSLEFMQFVVDVRAEVYPLTDKELFLFHTLRELASLILSRQPALSTR